MRAVPHHQRLAAFVFLLALIFGFQASAQDRGRVEIVPQVPHTLSVNSVAFSHDGARVLSGSDDNTLKLWDAVSGALMRTFEHEGAVFSLALSPDGASVLSSSAGKTMKLWDLASGALLRTFEGQRKGSFFSVAISPDGTRILSGGLDKTIVLLDAASGAVVRTFGGHDAPVSSVAFSPNGTRVLSGSHDKTLKVWAADSGTLVRTFEGHSQSVLSVRFSSDGTRILSGGQDNTVKLWDAGTGAVVRTFEGHHGPVNSIAFSPDGTRVLSGGDDQMLKLWDVDSGTLVRSFGGHTASVVSVAFSADGTRVLSGSPDRTLKLWDAATGTLVRTFQPGPPHKVLSIAFSPDGSRALAGGWSKLVQMWDASTGMLVRTFKGHQDTVTSVAFSPDGARVLSASQDKTLRLWDGAAGTLVRTFKGHSQGISSVRFSSDGKRVLSGGSDKTVKLWDAATGALLRTFEGHQDTVTSVAFSPDGTRLLSGGWDRTLKLWDAASGALMRTFELRPTIVFSAAFAPDGTRVVSGGSRNTLKVWDVATGALVRAFDGVSGSVRSVAFSPDGARVLSGGEDNTLKLWDVATGALVRTFSPHFWVSSVAFSPDGRRIMSSSHNTVSIWDPATGAQLAILIGGPDGEWLAMTPAGFFAASKQGSEFLSIVRGLETYSVMQFYDHLHRPDLVEEILKGDPESKHKDAARRMNLERVLDSGPTPSIELLPDRTEKSGETVKLAARIIDQGGGIGPKVIWRVNGKTQGATSVPGLGGPPSIGNYVVMPQALTVDPGKKNDVEIIAYNGRGLLATPPLRFSIDAWGVATQERPRMFVLAVGVDKYARKDWELSYAVKDASAFAAALKLVGSPLFGEPHVKVLRDDEVTERTIAAEFDRLSSVVKARDVFVLFLGGHGRSIAGEGWFYLPQDLDLAKGHTVERNAIGQDRWQAWMAKIPAQKSLTILDACESGANEAFRGGDRERETVMAQLEYATGRNTISAAAAGKAAYEGYRGHGVLTYAILEALNRQEGTGADPINVFGLATHVSLQVPIISQREFGVRQQPRFTPTGDNFPLGLRAALLPPLSSDGPISLAPTHVNPVLLKVLKQPGGKGAVVLQLAPYSPVTLIKSEHGWAYIAREGKALGYVPEGKLKRLAAPDATSAAPPERSKWFKWLKKSAPADDPASVRKN